MRDLPAHHQHQAEAEQQENQRRQAVLDADDLVIGGEDVLAPEARLFVMRFVDAAVRQGMSGCLHCSFELVRLFERCPSPTIRRASILRAQ